MRRKVQSKPEPVVPPAPAEAGVLGAGLGAGLAAGVAAVLPSALAGAPSPPPPAAGAAVSPDFSVPAGPGEEYRSLYHPEPLNWIAGAVRVRSRAPPQCGQVVSGASENFWIFSTRRLHCWHWYS